MVYTRFGGQVKIIKRETEGSDWILVERESGAQTCFLLQDLRADGGIKEIVDILGE